MDIHNKLAVGPRSINSVGANHLLLKIWLTMVAMCETNAYLMYTKHKKLTSEKYSHGDFKLDLERALIQRACALEMDVPEEAGTRARRSADSVATGDSGDKREQMPAAFQGHQLRQDRTKNRKCLICGTQTKWMCECGRAICGSSTGATCWAWHLESIVSGTIDDVPVQWQRRKRSRSME